MSTNNKRSIFIVLIILLFGCIIGTALSQLFSLILPDSVVKQFFLKTTSIGWGNSSGWVDFNIIRFKSGFYIDISVLSLIGLMISWYFLRYFR
tara:strand:- start:538 stop:816 length:279 start_codon:yes stop_codon:yes gene_type:complete